MLMIITFSVYSLGSYLSFYDLKEAEIEGIDYNIDKQDNGKDITIFSIHGGHIGIGISNIVRAINSNNDYNHYLFEGTKPSDNLNLHITSTLFDEPLVKSLIEESGITVSFIAIKGNDETTIIGGQNKALGLVIAEQLREKGFDVINDEIPAMVAGISNDNVVNKNKLFLDQYKLGGVQIALPRKLRDGFEVNENKFSDFTKAIQNALNTNVSRMDMFIQNSTPYINSTGVSLYSNENVTLSGSSQIKGDVKLFNNHVHLGWSTRVLGNVYTLSEIPVNITEINSNGNIDGEILNHLNNFNYSPFNIPKPDFNNSNEVLIVNKNTNIDLLNNDAFSFRRIRVINNSTLNIDIGNNTEKNLIIESLDLNNGKINIIGDGTLNIFVDEIKFGSTTVEINDNNANINTFIFSSEQNNLILTGDSKLNTDIIMQNVNNFEITNSAKILGDFYFDGENLTISGNSEINGLTYAPNADTVGSGSSKMRTAIVNSFNGSGTFQIQ